MADDYDNDFERSLDSGIAIMASGVEDEIAETAEADTPSQRQRFAFAEKIQIFQSQISKIKREMLEQQEEIKQYTEELRN